MKSNSVAVLVTAALLAGLAPSPAQARERGWDRDRDRGRDRDWCEVRKRPRHDEPVRRWYRGSPPWASEWRGHGNWVRSDRVVVRETRTTTVVPVLVPPVLVPSREVAGILLGGTAGGILGAQVGRGGGRPAAVAGGILLGALVGGSIGRTMDLVDHGYVAGTLEYAPTGEAVRWRNPDTSARYEVTPLETYQRDDGRYCREYQTTAVIGGREQEIYGTACRQPDGSWEVVP